jgi:hypothetical protein
MTSARFMGKCYYGKVLLLLIDNLVYRKYTFEKLLSLFNYIILNPSVLKNFY